MEIEFDEKDWHEFLDSKRYSEIPFGIVGPPNISSDNGQVPFETWRKEYNKFLEEKNKINNSDLETILITGNYIVELLKIFNNPESVSLKRFGEDYRGFKVPYGTIRVTGFGEKIKPIKIIQLKKRIPFIDIYVSFFKEIKYQFIVKNMNLLTLGGSSSKVISQIRDNSAFLNQEEKELKYLLTKFLSPFSEAEYTAEYYYGGEYSYLPKEGKKQELIKWIKRP